MSAIGVGGAPRTERLPRDARHISGGRAPAWWGMVMLVFTEATLFGILFVSYFFLRFQSGPVWPPDGLAKPDLSLVAVMTPILLVSSLPMHWAETGIRRGKQWRLRLGLLAVLLLAAAFMVLLATEYRTVLTDEFTPRTNVYGSLFFTITGFHGLHVLVGIAMNLWTQFYAWRGRFTSERHVPVQNVALYWHFVDAVWIFVLATVYLSPHLWP